jgi:DNA (cytosine-5)-methyltransferase 1
MIYGSVCSGIEAATAAWHPLGWRPAFFSEIDKFPRAVLAHHYPTVPLHGDFTTIEAGQYAAIDVLVGGTPCQSFSIAGLRGGLADDRGNLALEYLRLAQRLRPRWLVWENVPGVLSSLSHEAPDPCAPPPPVDMELDGQEVATEDDYGSEELHALQCFLAGVSELGYGWSYRVFDAQFAGVPQRRRRVFVVGYLGDWRPAAAVLFEPESLRGDPAPRREAGEGIADPLAAGTRSNGGYRNDADTAASLVASNGGLSGKDDPAGRADADGGNNSSGPIDVATARNAHAGPHGRLDFESETFVTHAPRADGFDASEDGTGRGTPLWPVCYSIMPMNSGTDYKAREVDVAQPVMAGGPVGGNQGGDYIVFSAKDHGADAGEMSPTLRAGPHHKSHANAGVMPAVLSPGMAVRRLTPRECERLQGFPDDYTLIPYRGKPAQDWPRYKALGNSMAVPVMRWIGQRIDLVNRCL